MQCSLYTIGDAFICKTCERAGVGEDIDKQENLDLRNKFVSSPSWKVLLSPSVVKVRRGSIWFRELSGILTRKDVSLKLKREGVCDMCEECNGVWKRNLGHE